jgi:squalene-associated FAD-dependent desaturase
MTKGAVHVIGAGLAGLGAAVALAHRGVPVELSEAAGFAGGRCRSYFEPQLQRVVDNGNHLILSGNRAAFAYLKTIGAETHLIAPERADFTFADLRNGERWTVSANDGVFPWWIFCPSRRVPGTRARDYLRILPLLKGSDGRLGTAGRGALWEKLIHPFLLAALNTEPETASRKLAASVMRKSLAAGGKAFKPRIAHPTLSAAFIDPALSLLKARGAQIRFGRRLYALKGDGDRIDALEFAHGPVKLAADDAVILAVPAPVAASFLPLLTVPDDFRAIVSGHFGIAPPPGTPAMIGVLGGTVEWIFSFPDRVSVTVSNADRLVDTDRAALAELFWRETAAVLGLPRDLPPWQIVKEKRATFAATPEQEKKRPPAATPYRNLFLAGDWTDTGLPATIEGALRSGNRAAQLALSHLRV